MKLPQFARDRVSFSLIVYDTKIAKNGIAVLFCDISDETIFLFCGKHLKKQKTE